MSMRTTTRIPSEDAAAMTTRPVSISIGLALALGLIAGCDAEKPKGKATSQVKARETIGKTTQNVLKLTDALAQGGVLAATTIEATDPLTQSGDAYKTQVAKIGAMAVKQAIDIRNASSIQDPKPLTYDEFMAEIIKKDQPDGMQLAMLPYYQEYAWDEANQKLVVVEFPKKKADFQKQQDEKLGRR